MMKSREDKRIPFCDIASGLNQGVESADPLRAAGLQRLARVRAVRETGLKREQERLRAKLGAGHPRVLAVQTKIDANRELLRDVNIGIARGQTPTVQPDKQAWILHGHVRDRDRAGIPNLTVALYDADDQWIQELGYACTDKTGYFKIISLRVKPEPADTEPAAEGGKAEPGQKVYIHVLSQQGAHLYADKQPLMPERGRVDYREIILDREEGVCRPPEAPGGPGEEKATRYLGNSSNREVHDLTRRTRRCQIDEIRPDHRVYFKTQKEAVAAGYDYCAYCFGKEKSKR